MVFDLSSDDDVGWGKNIGADDDDCDRVEDCKWIQDFFNDDSDDVVFVSEVVVKPKDRKLKIVTNNYVKDFNHGDDDDDCVILDGDPDKEVEAVEGLKTQDDATQSDSDELIVVGETGQVYYGLFFVEIMCSLYGLTMNVYVVDFVFASCVNLCMNVL